MRSEYLKVMCALDLDTQGTYQGPEGPESMERFLAAVLARKIARDSLFDSVTCVNNSI